MAEPASSRWPSWKWLLLLLPAGEFLLVCRFAGTIATGLGMHQWLPGLEVILYNLPIAAALAVATGFGWAARERRWFLLGLGRSAIVLLLNGGLLWAGFALYDWSLRHERARASAPALAGDICAHPEPSWAADCHRLRCGEFRHRPGWLRSG